MANSTRRQQAFDDLVTTTLARFSSSVASDLDKHIRDSLGEISRFIGIEYAYIAHTPPDYSTWSVTHEWCAPGGPSLIAQYQNVPMGTFYWTEQVILAGQTLRLNSLDEIPPEAAEVRKRIQAAGFKSTLQVPLRPVDGRVSGCIALSSLHRETRWSDADIQRLRLVGESIANALCRQRAEIELRKSESRYRATFEQLPLESST